MICPRLFITVNAAASTVACIAGLTTSTAAIGATLGIFYSNCLASEAAFLIICAFCSKSGAIFIAASVTIVNRLKSGTAKTAKCDKIFPVLSPYSLFKTAFKKNISWDIPFH